MKGDCSYVMADLFGESSDGLATGKFPDSNQARLIDTNCILVISRDSQNSHVSIVASNGLGQFERLIEYLNQTINR